MEFAHYPPHGTFGTTQAFPKVSAFRLQPVHFPEGIHKWKDFPSNEEMEEEAGDLISRLTTYIETDGGYVEK